MLMPASQIEHWANKYIGVPFRAHGRDMDGVDCYGLVWLIYKREFRILLPDYLRRYGSDLRSAEVENLFSAGLQEPFWHETLHPRAGDVVLLRIQGQAYHVGVMVDAFRMIHAQEEAACNVESVRAPLWRSRVLGYFVYRECRNAA